MTDNPSAEALHEAKKLISAVVIMHGFGCNATSIPDAELDAARRLDAFAARKVAEAVAAERERCLSAAEAWQSAGDILLQCGEMTAQEVRTAKAVAAGIAAAIRNNT